MVTRSRETRLTQRMLFFFKVLVVFYLLFLLFVYFVLFCTFSSERETAREQFVPGETVFFLSFRLSLCVPSTFPVFSLWLSCLPTDSPVVL